MADEKTRTLTGHEDWLRLEDYDHVLVIYGVRYAREIFEHLGLGPVGSVVKIVQRKDGVLTLERVEQSQEAA